MLLPPLIFGKLIRRYKRFLADVELEDGSVITVHCPNTGRMTSCAEPGWRVALCDSRNPKRKYRFTWELVHNGQCWICVNTGRANDMAAEAVASGMIPEFSDYAEVLREQTFGSSRFDLLLKRAPSGKPVLHHGRAIDKAGVERASRRERAAAPPRGGDAKRGEDQSSTTTLPDLCYVEVKNVTLLADDGCYAFPDAVTERGRKHLNELVNVVKAGHRAAMLFVIPRSDGNAFRAAKEIDPDYSAALNAAATAGVEIHAWRADVSPEALLLSEPVAWER